MFRPGWIPTLFMIFGVSVTASLGVWQLGRHQDKQALTDSVLAGLDAPVLDAEDLSGDRDGLWYRKVELQGRFVEPLALTAGRIEFGRGGYGVVQPLLLDDGTRVLVERGWVPREGLAEALRTIDTGDAVVTVQGQLRPVEDPLERSGLSCDAGRPEPLPDVEGRPETWPPGSWGPLVERLPEPALSDGLVLAGEPILAGEGKNPDRLPVDGYQPLPRLRDSLSYAFQWWLFGIMLVVVWVALGITRGREARTG